MRAAAHARQTARQRGVAWAGLQAEPFRPRSPDMLLRSADLWRQALEAWRASRAGRLNAAFARAQSSARAAHAAAEALRAALARNHDDACGAPLRELCTHASALMAAAQAAVDAEGLAALSDGACATNTASSRPSTGSRGSSAS